MSKKIGVLLLFFALLLGLGVNKSIIAATTFANPYIWADVPDQDVIRVGNTYYMSSTTMHMNPGVPIMKSYDLINWEIVNYVYDTLASNDVQTLSNGKSEYGRGSWASSLRYNNGTYYVCFSSYSTGKTYIYQTKDIEKGPWTSSIINSMFHDMSMLFDGTRVFLVSGSNNINVTELTSDAKAVKSGGLNKTIITNAGAIAGTGGLGAEGSHIQKINGKYYIFLISWPSGGSRTELCYRADSIDGTYTGKVVLKDSGIAQGGIVDTASGNWYACLFRDSGSVGRIPYLVPVTWSSDGWPVFGVNSKVPLTMNRPVEGYATKTIYASDEFLKTTNKLPLVWQWNHNPDNTKWSLTARPGFLRLTTGNVTTSLLNSKNTLTQRTFGPTCSGNIAIDISNMKDGDVAGLAALQQNYGFVGVKMSGTKKSIVMVNASSGSDVEVANVTVNQSIVYLKLNCDYTNRTDKSTFYYSLDGTNWIAIGNSLQMSYTIPQFIGYRFALFNYSTKVAGGFVDFDYFRIPGVGESNTTPTNTMGDNVTLNDGWYYIKNVNAKKYLQVATNVGKAGQNVELSAGSELNGQKWYLTNVADGCVTLKSGLGEYMIDVSNGANTDGANIQIYNAYGNDAQKFSIKSSPTTGEYAIATMASNQTKVLDDYNAETADGANVCQWTYNGNNNQLWAFEPTGNITYKLGDLNKDGNIDITDCIQLKEFILYAYNDSDLTLADLNGDKKLNIIDYIQLKKLIG